MKILIIIDYFQPIIGYSETFIAKEYIKQWHNVLVLTSDHYYPFPDYENTSGKMLWSRKQEIWLKIEEWILTKREKLVFEIFNRAYFKNINKHIDDFRPDIVIVNWIASITVIIVAILKRKFGFKLVSWDSNLMSIINQWIKIKQIFYFIFRIFFSKFLEKKVDKFVGVQEETCEIINKFYWIKKELIEFIPLWTDIDKFRFDEIQRNDIRVKYNIPANAIVLIYTGKLIIDKWYDILIKATSKIIQDFDGVYVFIIWSWPENLINEMNEYIKNYKERFVFIDFVKNDELYKYFSASDIWIWPLQESVSMVEAAACNLPFIANDKIWTKLRISNDNALLYKQGDIDDLYEKIKYLIENKDDMINMWKRWRELVENKLSWNEIAKEYLIK
ncbi:MAG: glycosyltransferase [uncultured bacterium (gcode 4)]|uniref:Glycosyltransferase n=1 Tax=uncultured bacterium (gcode 4) TaxID=1234023 RepID=K2FWD8_9BACT|nr:MAG: glycosyltransferase [uncultured bacterium (gcode 4)]